MDPVILIEYVLLSLAFVLYQIWTFINQKSLKVKLIPMFIACGLGILLSFFVPWYIFMFAVVLIETTLYVTMAVILVEIILEAKNPKNSSRIIKLIVLEILFIFIFLWLRRIM
ncbi:hypothetical protein [Bacillus sp. Marseille-Q3570]|uniref:hypothetical protein n=1 Tax=Bacillus sp. Marseille-Q3570 TaxID=2963522 RepID=UPI0021B7FE3E|nr:hypothetical protein [Bacillus sp. Marseille-Q3570]